MTTWRLCGGMNRHEERENESETNGRREKRDRNHWLGKKGKLFSRLIETNNSQFTHSTSCWAGEVGEDYYRSFNGWFEIRIKVK